MMVKVNTNNAAYYVDQITEAWQSSVKAIIRAGQLLIEAKAALNHGEWQTMFEGPNALPFTDRTAQMLMKVAGHAGLSNPKLVSGLPPSWGTLHVLSKFSPEKLEALIADGKIHSDIKRSDANELWVKTVRDGIPWYPTVRENLNELLTLSKKETVVGMLAQYLVDETETKYGPPIVDPHQLYQLSGWINELGRACEGVQGDGYKEGSVTIRAAKPERTKRTKTKPHQAEADAR